MVSSCSYLKERALTSLTNFAAVMVMDAKWLEENSLYTVSHRGHQMELTSKPCLKEVVFGFYRNLELWFAIKKNLPGKMFYGSLFQP